MMNIQDISTKSDRQARLTEAPIYQEVKVIEAKKGDPYPTHTHIKAKVSEADRRNLNGRVYPLSVWEANLPKLNADLAKRPGAAFHPAMETEVQDVAVRWTNVWLEGKDVMAEGIVVPTRVGQDLDACVRSGVQVGVSSRGYGSVESGLWEGEESDIIQEDYECETFDTVIKPSSQGAGIYAYESEVRQKMKTLLEMKAFMETLSDAEYNEALNELFEAKWSTKSKNDLPDSAFALIHSPVQDKSKDRALPYKNADGKVDPAHVRNALARLPLVKGFSDAEKAAAKAKLQRALKSVGGEPGDEEEEKMKTKEAKMAPHNHVHSHVDEQGNYMYSHEHPHTHAGEGEHSDSDAHMHGHMMATENAEVDALGNDAQFISQQKSSDLGEETQDEGELSSMGNAAQNVSTLDASALELDDEEKETDTEVAEKAKDADGDDDAENPDDDEDDKKEKYDPDNDGDDDSTASGDTDHDFVKADGTPGPKAKKKKDGEDEAITQVGQQIVHALQRGDSTAHGVKNDVGSHKGLENDMDVEPEDEYTTKFSGGGTSATEDVDDDNMGADNGKVKDAAQDDDPDATKKQNSKPRGESKLQAQLTMYAESSAKLNDQVTQLSEENESLKTSVQKVEKQRDAARSRVSLINKLVETCKAEKFSWSTFVHLLENVKSESEIEPEVKKARGLIENTLMSIGKSPAGSPIIEKDELEEIQKQEEYESVDFVNRQMIRRR